MARLVSATVLVVVVVWAVRPDLIGFLGLALLVAAVIWPGTDHDEDAVAPRRSFDYDLHMDEIDPGGPRCSR
jgi:hypothetical protein